MCYVKKVATKIPLGNSLGLTSSRKKSWATCACLSPSVSHDRNQKRNDRDSCECWCVFALTRNTRNSRLRCGAVWMDFCSLSASLLIMMPVWSPPATCCRSPISSTSFRSMRIIVELEVFPRGVITTFSVSSDGGTDVLWLTLGNDCWPFS